MSQLSSSLPKLYHCRWNWCREYFRSREALIDHIAQHLNDAQPVRAGDLKALRKAEEGQSFEQSFLPHFSQTISSGPSSSLPTDTSVADASHPQLVPDDSTSMIPRPTHESGVGPFSQFSQGFSPNASRDEVDVMVEVSVDVSMEVDMHPPHPPSDPEALQEMSQYIRMSSPDVEVGAAPPTQSEQQAPERTPSPERDELMSSPPNAEESFVHPFATQAPPPPTGGGSSSASSSQSDPPPTLGPATQLLLATHKEMMSISTQHLPAQPSPPPTSPEPERADSPPRTRQNSASGLLSRIWQGLPQLGSGSLSQSRSHSDPPSQRPSERVEETHEEQSGFMFATQAPLAQYADSQESF